MFEHHTEPLLTRSAFARRLLAAFFLTISIVVGSVAFGVAGFHWIAGLSWDHAFHHTCLILGDHDVHTEIVTPQGRLFAGLFLLYGRLVFFSLMTILLVPVLHRIFHKLHLNFEEPPGGM